VPLPLRWLLILTTVAGCAGGTTGNGSSPSVATGAAPTGQPSASPSGAPTARPTAAPSTPEATLDTGIPVGEVPAGTYTAAALDPSFLITLDSGWRHELDSESRPDRALLLVATSGPFDEAMYFDTSAATADPSVVLTNTFGRLQGVTLGPITPATIGGAPGVMADAIVADELPTPSIQIFGLAEHYELRPGDRFRAFVLDVGDRAMFVIIESNGDAFEPFLARASAILESVTFPAG
jgi:hypothetical protein